MSTPIEQLASLVIGEVESAAPDEIHILLEADAPSATALNTGTPTSFPRLNSYVLMPNEVGATIAQIIWMGSQRSQYPKRGTHKELDLIDLPFPLRKLCVSPVGTLTSRRDRKTGKAKYELVRGIVAFPSVGDQVLMPTPEQIESIVGGKESDRRVRIGSSPMCVSVPIMVDPDKLFGRHLAVLGNTGSGKSCTVAGLIRWSLKAAETTIRSSHATAMPNARFIVLDPNGEYSRAFRDLRVRRFQVDGSGEIHPLKVPSWLWNGDEWAAFTGAAPGVQRPILFDALRRLRSEEQTPDQFETRVRYRVRNYLNRIRLILSQGGYMGFPRREDCAVALLNLSTAFSELAAAAPEQAQMESLTAAAEAARNAEEGARSFVDQQGNQRHSDFEDASIEAVQTAVTQVAALFQIRDDNAIVGEDVPRFFSARELPGFVEALAADQSGRDVSQFVDSLNLRIRGLFAAGALASVADPGDTPAFTLQEWLTSHIGDNAAANGQLAIIDLSLVPSEAIHIVVAVLGRMIFEAVQRHRRINGSSLPTVLVLDEAHTFAHKDLTLDGAPASGRTCCRTFERIAREGRKFGLGLVLASQRPSEMSPTVLSQCNTFLLHRIVNDADQNLVSRFVPDNVRGLLRELPSLPSRQAILLGWATPIPILVEIEELQNEHCPESADPDFWDVWTLAKERPVNWENIATEWQQLGPAAPDE